jgi:TolA-binding protein
VAGAAGTIYAAGSQLSPEAQWRVATAHWQASRWELAAEEFQLFLQHWPNHPKSSEAIFYLAESLLRLSRFAEAAQEYARLAESARKTQSGRVGSVTAPAFPQELVPVVMFRLAETTYLASRDQASKREEAQRLLSEFRQQWTDHPLVARAWNYLGQIHSREKNWLQAKECFAQSLKSNPEDLLADRARYGLAEALEHLGQRAEAERFYQALAYKKTSPLAPQATWKLVQQFVVLKENDKAIEALEHFLRSWPEHSAAPRARLLLARLFLLEEKPEPAEALLQPLKNNPQLAGEAYYWLAVARLLQRDGEGALSLLGAAEKSSTESPLNAWIQLRRAEALVTLNRPREALLGLAPFLEIVAGNSVGNLQEVPQEADFREQVGRVGILAYLAAEDPHNAAGLARVIVAAPDFELSWQTKLAAVRALLAVGEGSEAGRLLDALEALDLPPSAMEEMKYLRGLWHLNEGRQAEATRHWSELAEQGGGKYQVFACLRLAEQARQHGDFSGMLTWANRALEHAERHSVPKLVAESLCLLAGACLHEGEISRAEEAVTRLALLPIEPTFRSEKLLEIAREAEDQKQLALAIQILESLTNEQSDPSKGHEAELELAWCYLQLGKLTEAWERLDRVCRDIHEGEPNHWRAWLLRGQLAELSERPEEALSAYEQLLWQGNRKEGRWACWRTALLYHSRGDYELAACRYELADQLAGAEVPREELLFRWAAAERVIGSLRFQEILTRLIQDYPQSIWAQKARVELAELAVRASCWAEADGYLRELVTGKSLLSPEWHQRAQYLWATTLAGQGRWAEAEVLFRELARQTSPGEYHGPALFGLAESCYQQSKWDEAEAAFQEYLRFADSAGSHLEGETAVWPVRARLRIVQIFSAQEKWEEVVAAAQRFLPHCGQSAECAETAWLAGQARYRQGKLNEARQFLSQTVTMAERLRLDWAAQAQLLLAETYYLQGDYRSALREYLRLEILFPKSQWVPGAVLQVARCYDRLGRREEAIRQCQRLLETWPDSPFANQARECLRSWQTLEFRTVSER